MITKETILQAVKDKEECCVDQYVTASSLCYDAQANTWVRKTSIESLKTPLDVLSHAESQLLGKMGIPAGYFHKCSSDLKAENANYWLKQLGHKQLFARLMNGQIRAFFSSRYSPELDDHKVFPVILRQLENCGEEFEYHAFYSEFNLTVLRVLFPNIKTEHEGQEFIAGMSIVNSEVGSSALWIKPFICIKNQTRSYNLISTRKFGSTRIIHVGDISTEQVRSAVQGIIEKAQHGIRTAIISMHEPVERPVEAIRTIVAETNFIPSRLIAILEEEYQYKQNVTKLQIAQSILDACENLPLFQKYHAEAEVGKYLHLFERDDRRLEDVLGIE